MDNYETPLQRAHREYSEAMTAYHAAKDKIEAARVKLNHRTFKNETKLLDAQKAVREAEKDAELAQQMDANYVGSKHHY